MYNILLYFKTIFYISENETPELYKNRGRSAMLKIFPWKDLQWKVEDLQCYKPSPLGEGLQCCRSSGGRFAMLQIFRGGGDLQWKGEDLQCYKRGRSAMSQIFRGRFAMLQIFRGEVCNVANLPGGTSARGKVYYTTSAHQTMQFLPLWYKEQLEFFFSFIY